MKLFLKKKKKTLGPNPIAPVEFFDNNSGKARENMSTQTPLTSLPATFIPAPFGYQNSSPIGALKGFTKQAQKYEKERTREGKPFVVVYTPHFLRESAERGAKYDKNCFESKITTIFERIPPDQDYGSRFGQSFVYFMKKYNAGRQRWELELISCTPDIYFNTPNNPDAKYIELGCGKGKSMNAGIKKFTKTAKNEELKELKPFYVDRIEDETGVSGTGVVAYGVVLPSGKVVMEWDTATSSITLFNNIKDVEKIHGHGGKTQIKFMEKNASNKRLDILMKVAQELPDYRLDPVREGSDIFSVVVDGRVIGWVDYRSEHKSWFYSPLGETARAYGKFPSADAAVKDMIDKFKMQRVSNLHKQANLPEIFYQIHDYLRDKGMFGGPDFNRQLELEHEKEKEQKHKKILEKLKKKYKEQKRHAQVIPGSSLNTSLANPNQGLIDSPRIEIEPAIREEIEDAVQMLQSSNPSYFKGVSKIVALNSGPYGQVSSDDASVIHLNVNRIKNEIRAKLGGFNESNPEHREAFEDAIKKALIEVIAHEKGHVLDWDPEQNKFPGGEGAAEREVHLVIPRVSGLKGFTKTARDPGLPSHDKLWTAFMNVYWPKMRVEELKRIRAEGFVKDEDIDWNVIMADIWEDYTNKIIDKLFAKGLTEEQVEAFLQPLDDKFSEMENV